MMEIKKKYIENMHELNVVFMVINCFGLLCITSIYMNNDWRAVALFSLAFFDIVFVKVAQKANNEMHETEDYAKGRQFFIDNGKGMMTGELRDLNRRYNSLVNNNEKNYKVLCFKMGVDHEHAKFESREKYLNLLNVKTSCGNVEDEIKKLMVDKTFRDIVDDVD